MKIHELSACDLKSLLKDKKTTAPEIFQSCQDRISATNAKVNSFVRTTPDAGASAAGEFPFPIGIKDNMCVKGEEITCCSMILKGFRPTYDATVVEKLKNAGVPIAGITNMDEFAFGSSTENSCYGPARNPWNTGYVPGGSSGGSSAAVGANQITWALGSDTGGSIRQPAAFCGVVGVKPTYGRVSRYGLIAFASSLDQIGPITKTVEDAAALLKIIAGYDEKDSTSANLPVPDYAKALEKDIKGLRIGIPKEYFIEGMDPEVKEAVRATIEVLKKQGAEFVDISLPHTEYCVATYYIVATAEASSNLARYDGVRYGLRKTPPKQRKNPIVDMFEETRQAGFGAEAKRRIMLGTYVLSSGYYDAYYLRGLKTRTLIKKDFDEAFKELDAVIAPTSPTTAFKIGERTSDPLSMYLSDIYTISCNLSGIPGMSIPCGFSKAGLPIGLQIMTKAFDEEMMLRIGHHYQQKTDWHQQKADL